MAFLPDTNVWISLLKNPGGKLEARVQSQAVSEIFLCAVVKVHFVSFVFSAANSTTRLPRHAPKNRVAKGSQDFGRTTTIPAHEIGVRLTQTLKSNRKTERTEKNALLAQR